MNAFSKTMGSAALTLILAAGLAAPVLAQKLDNNTGPAPTFTSTTAVGDIDFGDDSGDWTNDGECDDPRFTGTGMAAQLIDEDRFKDATDCREAFTAGTITFIGETGTSPADIAIATPIDAIDFGDDTSKWANDDECDDPRFIGSGSAQELVDADILKDATDCRAAYAAGTVTLADAETPAVSSGAIDYGNDTSEWANDGECDDPRFSGTGVAPETIAADIRKDATDCQAAVEAGTATFNGDDSVAGATPATFDYGSDYSKWANDGECDDWRFTGAGMDKKLNYEDVMADATDCKALEAEGRVTIKPVWTPEYAAAAPHDTKGIDFGDDTSSYANDDQCDDPRFEGPGAASTLLDSDLEHDATDCEAAFKAGTIALDPTYTS